MTNLQRNRPDKSAFNQNAILPYQLRLEDFEIAMQDVYDLLFDLNSTLLAKGLQRMEEMMRPAGFSGLLSDALTVALAKHARVLTQNGFHNGHPDLIPAGVYAMDRVAAGDEGVEVKATRRSGAVDTHGARNGWLCVFRYRVDSTTQPVVNRLPTRFIEVSLAKLTTAHFRRNPRGELGTRTASPNAQGMALLRANRVYLEP